MSCFLFPQSVSYQCLLSPSFLFSPPFQERHQSPLRATLQGRNTSSLQMTLVYTQEHHVHVSCACSAVGFSQVRAIAHLLTQTQPSAPAAHIWSVSSKQRVERVSAGEGR